MSNSKDIINSIYGINVRSSEDTGDNINNSIERWVYNTFVDEYVRQILIIMKGLKDFSE